MENYPELSKQISHTNSNARFTFGATDFQYNSEREYVPKQIFKQLSAESNQNQVPKVSNENKASDQQFSNQMILHLLELEQKWIQKETQIKDYVEGLKKTVEEKDLKIEKLHMENYKLSSKLKEIGKQNNEILQKLNQIHQAMTLLQTQRLRNDSENKMNEKSHLNQQKQFFSQFLKLKKQKDTPQINSPILLKFQSIQKNSERQNNETESKNMEKRILSNLIKLFEQNFNVYPSLGSGSSSQKYDKYLFAKKERDIRVTMTTNDTRRQKFQEQIIQKSLNSQIYSQQQNPSQGTTKKPKCYKSARTITFSKDQEVHDQEETDKEQFYSHNAIKFDPKLYSESDKSEQKQSQISKFKIQNQNNETQKESQSNSLRIQSKAFDQSYQISKFSKQKRKRSKQKKNTTNLDYFLSSSSISETQTNEIDSKRLNKDEEQVFKPLTHENNEHQKNQIGLSKLSISSTNMNRSNTNQTAQYLKPLIERNSIQTSHAINQQIAFSPSLEKSKINSKADKLQVSRKQVNRNSKNSYPQISQIPKQAFSVKNNAFAFQISPQTKSSTMSNTDQLHSSGSKNNFIIERQNSITFENTNQKKPSFDPNSLDLMETQVKNYQFDTNQAIQNEKTRLFVQAIGPETKCSSFEEKSCGNSFYFNKSSSSNDPFKRLKLSSENSENKQQNKSDKLMFENQMLKSYNKVLEKQTKKMSQTEKLMQRFNSQNVSILNKIHKRSIS